MDLFAEFEKRRGIDPPIVVPKKADAVDEVKDTWQVLAMAFAGQLKKSYLIPVLPEYQIVFGTAIWICPDEDKVQAKQKDAFPAFTPDELQDIILIAAKDRSEAVNIIVAKKAFSGIITR
jgi:hypothetical protein